MYTCIIVDDQAEAVDLIRDHVSKIARLTISLSTTNSIEALVFLDRNKPDIIFLDIEMPGMTGIELTRTLKAKWGNNMPKIVFTTGHADYALTGYEHGVADYLLKPVTFIRFKQCSDRIIDELDKQHTRTGTPSYFFIEDGGKKVKIPFEEIIYIKSEGNYLTIVSENRKKTIYRSLNTMQELLPGSRFFRVHKSYIAAIDRVHSVKGNELVVHVKQEERCLPIGVTYKENVYRQLGIG
jgi:two-component system, LytTR family, response regulator